MIVILAAKITWEYQGVTTGRLTVGCDNDASLNKALASLPRAKVSDPYFNLTWAIHEVRDQFCIHFRPKHVRGHQDEHKNCPLTFYESLNVLMDKQAKLFRSRLDDNPRLHRPWLFGDHNWHVGVANTHFSYHLENSIRDHIQGSYIMNHLTTKGDLTRENFSFVDWDAIHRGSKLVTTGERLWMTKFVGGFCGTASQMFYRDIKKKSKSQEDFDRDYSGWKSDICPLCRVARENTKHVLICSHRKLQRYRDKQINDLENWLQTRKTDPRITKCITTWGGTNQDDLIYL